MQSTSDNNVVTGPIDHPSRGDTRYPLASQRASSHENRTESDLAALGLLPTAEDRVFYRTLGKTCSGTNMSTPFATVPIGAVARQTPTEAAPIIIVAYASRKRGFNCFTTHHDENDVGSSGSVRKSRVAPIAPTGRIIFGGVVAFAI